MAITVKELVESGAHFGHQKKKWNPKMKQYIYTVRKGTHIIDLQKASEMSQTLYNEVKEQATKGDILFVGTKKQAKDAIKKYAIEVEQPYVDNRWLGGTLTNFKTIKNRIQRLEDLENLFDSEDIEKYPKKEQMLMRKEMEKLDRFLGGIRNMTRMPKAVFIIDSLNEKNAIAEAKKLGIKVLGIADTDSNPDVFDTFMPSNDDAIKAVDLILSKMTKAVEEGKNERKSN
ncbi:MAG: 30S ribosomal protein S2 [Mycoplasmatales bacterium]